MNLLQFIESKKTTKDDFQKRKDALKSQNKPDSYKEVSFQSYPGIPGFMSNTSSLQSTVGEMLKVNDPFSLECWYLDNNTGDTIALFKK